MYFHWKQLLVYWSLLSSESDGEVWKCASKRDRKGGATRISGIMYYSWQPKWKSSGLRAAGKHHSTASHSCVHTPSSAVQWCSPDICICHSEGQYVSASVISKHFGVNILLIFSISTDDNVASSWESGKMLSGGHSSDVNCVRQMVLSVWVFVYSFMHMAASPLR